MGGDEWSLRNVWGDVPQYAAVMVKGTGSVVFTGCQCKGLAFRTISMQLGTTDTHVVIVHCL